MVFIIMQHCVNANIPLGVSYVEIIPTSLLLMEIGEILAKFQVVITFFSYMPNCLLHS